MYNWCSCLKFKFGGAKRVLLWAFLFHECLTIHRQRGFGNRNTTNSCAAFSFWSKHPVRFSDMCCFPASSTWVICWSIIKWRNKCVQLAFPSCFKETWSWFFLLLFFGIGKKYLLLMKMILFSAWIPHFLLKKYGNKTVCSIYWWTCIFRKHFKFLPSLMD